MLHTCMLRVGFAPSTADLCMYCLGGVTFLLVWMVILIAFDCPAYVNDEQVAGY